MTAVQRAKRQREETALYKIKLCKSGKRCKYQYRPTGCNYAHSLAELRAPTKGWQGTGCHYWETGWATPEHEDLALMSKYRSDNPRPEFEPDWVKELFRQVKSEVEPAELQPPQRKRPRHLEGKVEPAEPQPPQRKNERLEEAAGSSTDTRPDPNRTSAVNRALDSASAELDERAEQQEMQSPAKEPEQDTLNGIFLVRRRAGAARGRSRSSKSRRSQRGRRSSRSRSRRSRRSRRSSIQTP